MYRILVADDEGIMLEAFKNVISSTFGDSCIVETAKTGRAVTEIAETFHPDIVFMDIHMPGINGIQAMREIRKFNTTALFYVVSAYDKFDYAKEAIEKLKDSHALICLENRALIKMEKDKVYIWHSQWHSKLSRNDFISLFQQNTFEVYENDHGIDMEKDEEYYAWRNRYL